MKLVITGAAGRIGRHMVSELGPHHELVLLDRTPLREAGSVRADLTRPVSEGNPRRRHRAGVDRPSWERAFRDADAILHLAGDPSPRASLAAALRANVEGTWNVLRAAARNGVPRVVYASSSWAVRRELQKAALAGRRTAPGFGETSPDTPYGLSKAAAELAGRMAVESGQIECFVSVRIGSVCWRPAAEALDPISRRVAVDVADLRTILRLALERPSSGFHVVYGMSDHPDRLIDLTSTRRLLGWYPPDVHTPMTGEPHTAPSSS